jgi:hypothetical protein
MSVIESRDQPPAGESISYAAAAATCPSTGSINGTGTVQTVS